VSISGGLPQILCDGPNDSVLSGAGGAWNPDGVILFADTAGLGTLYRVSAAGGAPSVLIEPDKSRAERLGFPYFLPDGRRFLYLARSPQQEQSAVYLASLDSNERKRILVANSRVVYSPPGYLLFAQSAKLMAQPFDVRRGETTGDPFPVADRVAQTIAGVAAVSVSDNGILAFSEGGGGATTQLTWFDRTGKQDGIVAAPGANTFPWLSPDGQRLAVHRSDPAGNGTDVWLIDLLRGTNSRFTFEGGSLPVWSPDGKTILFAASRKGSPQGIYQKAASGTGNEELLAENVGAIMDWSSDGRFIIFRRDNNGTDVWALPTFGDRKAFPVMETKFNENFARLSADGRWLAYNSDESGRGEIYVQSFPPSGGKWQVSIEGAAFPRWRRDGRELLYNTLDGKIMAVDVKPGPTFEAGVPRILFDIPAPIAGSRWTMTPDAQRFLFPFTALQTGGPPPITVLTNWTAAIKK
jgi:Tol biopolymer transport system component